MLERLDQRLDSLGLTILREVQKIAGGQEAVIAGGYIRDMICKKDFKDIDIFLPQMSGTSRNHIRDALKSHTSFSYEDGKMENFGSHSEYDMNFAVYDYKYMESLPVQIIITGFPGKNFREHLVNSFDFGLCQVVAGDEYIFGTDAFEFDRRYRRMTLLGLKRVSELPRYMKRFLRLQEKYEGYEFSCPNLSIIKEEKKTPLSKKSAVEELNSIAQQLNISPGLIFNNTSSVAVQSTQGTFGAAPPTAPFVNPALLNIAMDTTIEDILTEDGDINWDYVDEFFALQNANVDNHIHTLLDQWSAINMDNSPEEPNQIPDGYNEA